MKNVNVTKMIKTGKISSADLKIANKYKKRYTRKELPFERRSNFVNKKCSWEIVDKSDLKYYFLGLEVYSTHHINGGHFHRFMKETHECTNENALRIIENKRHERSIAVLYFEIREKEVFLTGLSLTGNILRNITKQAIRNWIEYMELKGFSIKIYEEFAYDFGKENKDIGNNNHIIVSKGFRVKMQDFFS